MRDVVGKVAWITGAGSGIGEGSAVALAQAGMRLVLGGTDMALTTDALRQRMEMLRRASQTQPG